MSYCIHSQHWWGSDPPRTVALRQSFPVEPWPRPGAWAAVTPPVSQKPGGMNNLDLSLQISHEMSWVQILPSYPCCFSFWTWHADEWFLWWFNEDMLCHMPYAYIHNTARMHQTFEAACGLRHLVVDASEHDLSPLLKRAETKQEVNLVNQERNHGTRNKISRPKTMKFHEISIVHPILKQSGCWLEPMLPSAVENEAKSHHLEVAQEMQMHVAMIPMLLENPFLGKMMNIHVNPFALFGEEG